MNNIINTPDSRPEDRYYEFEEIIKNNFSRNVSKDTPLFKTDAKDLWDLYLDGIEKNGGIDARSHYNCNACKHFIERYGNLVTVNENGELESVIWNTEVPEFFKDSVKAMNKAVKKARIKTVFISDNRVLGIPRTGEWTHLSVQLPLGKTNRSRLLTEGQAMAEKREHYGMLSRALNEFDLETINKAIEILESETLYRGERVLGIAKWFKEVKQIISYAKVNKVAENLKWLAVAGAPIGFCSIKSSMIGTLLEDIQSGIYSYEAIKRRFDEKMDPSNYQRSQSAPTANAVQQAEKLVVDLGIANSLARRYATIDEVEEFIWKPRQIKKAKDTSSALGVFSHLKIQEDKDTSILDTTNMPLTVMTWDKFSRTILPEAVSIEAKVDNIDKFMALVNAVDEDSENILQWNNKLSWYYHGGIDSEIKKRVEAAGGRYENNEIRCSLIWEGRTDLDLHCITPHGKHIYWSDKRSSRCNGYLDLDMNGVDKSSDHPVENMRWVDNAPRGKYKFYVHNYNERVNGYKGTPFKVELEVNGMVYSYYGEPLKNNGQVTVFEFKYNGTNVEFITMPLSSSIETLSVNSNWNVELNSFVKVNCITKSPNLWGNNKFTNSGDHTFFLLEGCKDLSEGRGKGFFNEMLKPELKQIRKTLELFTAQTPIEGAEEATACGIGYSKDQSWNLTLRVKTNNSTRLIKIDRFD